MNTHATLTIHEYLTILVEDSGSIIHAVLQITPTKLRILWAYFPEGIYLDSDHNIK